MDKETASFISTLDDNSIPRWIAARIISDTRKQGLDLRDLANHHKLLDVLEVTVAKALQEAPQKFENSYENGEATGHISHFAVRAIAASFMHSFKKLGGKNYIELVVRDPADGEEFIVSIQRRDGKRPSEVAGELFDLLERLVDSATYYKSDDPEVDAAVMDEIEKVVDDRRALHKQAEAGKQECELERAAAKANRSLFARTSCWFKQAFARRAS